MEGIKLFWGACFVDQSDREEKLSASDMTAEDVGLISVSQTFLESV